MKKYHSYLFLAIVAILVALHFKEEMYHTSRIVLFISAVINSYNAFIFYKKENKK